jgi:NADPH:quinone reductase
MSQKALFVEQLGQPLVVGDRSIPQPSKNQLLVKVLVAGCRSSKQFHGKEP